MRTPYSKRFGTRAELVELTRARENRYVSPMAFAMLYARLGDKQRAISWLEKAYDSRDVEVPCLVNTSDSTFASIKNDPRVMAVLEKIRPRTLAR